ncbi:zinc metallopeptidase [Solirubrobacter soli]|uniref:zinc metallopeptidase n=1 Tax=Solirubrobacter soli TaxID=363832 RepID=UPI0003F64E5F|nr:zinc metallopeptidase [Solirubrobacter soli]
MTAVLWLLLLIPLAGGLFAQRRVQEVFMRYRRVPNRARVSGSEVATRLLGEHGLQRVRVEETPGALSDHYDGSAGALRLSEPVATERSVAAMGIAAHEVSHAYQDADGNRAYRIRKAVAEPLARFAPFSALFFIGGFWFGVPVLMALSLLYVFGLVVFALATLPVELGASRKALDLLAASHLADAEEVSEVRSVLRAAAFTYVAGLTRQLGFFAALILVAEAMDRAT